MFDHSIKVPRLYKTASKIAKDVSEGKGSIKQLVFECKHPNIKALYALVVHTFQKTDDIERLFKKSKILVKEPRFDPWLAKVLVTELLWGKKRLQSQAKPIKTILAYEQIFKAHLSDISSNEIQEFNQVEKPRYVRINTLKISINEAIEGFREEGWVLKRFTDSNNYLGFLEAISQLGPEEFMIDLHIPYLLIFPPKTQFYQHPAYKKGSIILQDKASCLPVHILNPEPGSTILDMCAAPGMKTTQCAAIINNCGNIHACEIGKKRFETLKKIVEASGATCVESINADVLTILGRQYPNVEYILVDPSCSGSGITDRVEIGQQEIDQHKNRLEKLAGFQIKVLRHALTKFPKVKRVVYSTCSIYPEENEDVVRQVLETCLYFKLVPANEFVNNTWQNFGSLEFGDIGNYCLYAKPDIDLTSGFFVAVFERLQEGETNVFLNKNLFINRRKHKSENQESEDIRNKIKNEKSIQNEQENDYLGDFQKTKIKEENLMGKVSKNKKIKTENMKVKEIGSESKKHKNNEYEESEDTRNEIKMEKFIKSEQENENFNNFQKINIKEKSIEFEENIEKSSKKNKINLEGNESKKHKKKRKNNCEDETEYQESEDTRKKIRKEKLIKSEQENENLIKEENTEFEENMEKSSKKNKINPEGSESKKHKKKRKNNCEDETVYQESEDTKKKINQEKLTKSEQENENLIKEENTEFEENMEKSSKKKKIKPEGNESKKHKKKRKNNYEDETEYQESEDTKKKIKQEKVIKNEQENENLIKEENTEFGENMEKSSKKNKIKPEGNESKKHKKKIKNNYEDETEYQENEDTRKKIKTEKLIKSEQENENFIKQKNTDFEENREKLSKKKKITENQEKEEIELESGETKKHKKKKNNKDNLKTEDKKKKCEKSKQNHIETSKINKVTEEK